MIPQKFPEANARYGPPEGYEESQVSTIHAWHGECSGGSCDGQKAVVVAWAPTPEELGRLLAGGSIYLTMFGGLAPHMLTADFHSATHPA